MTDLLLVHGAWDGPEAWDALLPSLEAAGLTARTVRLPLTSLAEDVAACRTALAEGGGPTVLVGHSYGGAVAAQAAAGEPAAAGLVFVAAFAVDEGESVTEVARRGPRTALDEALSAGPDATIVLDVGLAGPALHGDLGGRLPEGRVKRPLAADCFRTPAGPVAWRDLPSTYVRCSRDGAVSGEVQSLLADRVVAAGGSVHDLESDHCPQDSHPAELTAAIAAAVERVGRYGPDGPDGPDEV